MKISLSQIVHNISEKVSICRMSIETDIKLNSLDNAIYDNSLCVFYGMITEQEAVTSLLNKY